jgi:hypothetical protein
MSRAVGASEASIQADIRLALGRDPDVKLFRNNRGVAWMGKVESNEGGVVVLSGARPVEFGLTDGASDLIGLTRVLVTQAMVGSHVALFTAIENKRVGPSVPEHQRKFVAFVRNFGGLSGVARSVADAWAIVRPTR